MAKAQFEYWSLKKHDSLDLGAFFSDARNPTLEELDAARTAFSKAEYDEQGAAGIQRKCP